MGRWIGRKWRVGALCTLFAGASTAVPIVVLNTVASATSSPTQIIYVQKSGQQTTGPYVEYKGAGGNTSTQSLSLTSSTCSTPGSTVSTVSNPASATLLPLSASYYPSGYSSSSTPASVGSALAGSGSRGVAETGVCYKSTTSPGYTVQPDEGLVFSMGESNILTQGQLFSEASIPLKNNNRSPVEVDLVLRKANSSGTEQPVETVGPITVPAAGTESENDTNDCPVVSTGVASSADQFDQVELQVASPSRGSVSVIGPNCDSDNDADDQGLPTFTVANAAPIFTSAASDSVPAGASGTFTFPVSATGTPTPAFSVSGAPSGVSLTNTTSLTGTATLSGTGVAPGVHTFTIDATNSVATTAQSFTLTVLTTIVQSVASESGSTTIVASSGFHDQLVTTGQIGTETFSQSGSTPSGLDVSSSGYVTTSGTLSKGTYVATGTDSDSDGDVGSWTYSLTVNPVTITQADPTSGSTTTAESSSFHDQLAVTTGTYVSGATVTFSGASSTPAGVKVSSGGYVTTSGILASNTYVVSGNDSDGYGDSGSWSYTITVGSTPITQDPPTSGSTTTLASSGFHDQLVTTGQIGMETFSQSGSTPSGLDVSSSGYVTTSGSLSKGTYVATGTDSDVYGDASTSNWTYSLTVNPVTITQADPTSGSTTMADSSSFHDQLAVTTGTYVPGATVTFSGASSTPPGLEVSSSGSVTTSGTLSGNTYVVTGNDSDGYGDSGSWSYTLTVNQAPAITSLDNFIVPAPATGETGTTFTFTVATTGYPTPSLNDNGFAGCQANLPPTDMGFLFTDNGDGSATMSGTPTSSDGGTYTVCIDATNGVEPDATQTFTLYVTSPSAPLEACNSPTGNCPNTSVAASLDLDSGHKSFEDLTTSTGTDPNTGAPQGIVEFDTEGPMSETYTATLDVNWDGLGYCVPFSDPNGAKTCPPTYVVVPAGEGGTGDQTTSPGQVVEPCSAGQTTASLPTPPAVGWCSLSETYSYVDVGSTLETNIAEVLYGSGDMTVSHG
ncbi:MAG: hypothetical protein ACLP36_06445 [Acidimicrobiales bacterium]